MNFYKLDSAEPVGEIIANKILDKLNGGKKVFWIITGGSNIAVAVRASQLMSGQDLSNLTVTLSDERFGPIGHKDSNWFQLEQAGLKLDGAKLLPVLQGKDRRASTKLFAQNLKNGFDNCDYSIAICGIGPDGHTAGILPGSPNIDSQEMAVSYADNQAAPSVVEGIYRDKDRITMTAAAIAKLDEAIVIAFGKKPELFYKLEQDLSIEEMPAQALKEAKKLSIYNNTKGIAFSD